MDAAAVFHGVSLNDNILKGEISLINLTSILLRFREYPVAVCGDVTKMFYQVLVNEADKYAYLFLYKPPFTSGPPRVYRMTRHIFGSVCSPAVCMFVLRRAAQSGDPADSKLAVEQVDRSFYVDNWVTSFQSEKEARDNAEALTRALQSGGFQMGQWGSSSASVLASLPGQRVTSLDVGLDGLPTERTLGMVVDFESDQFVLKVSGAPSCTTRREILRATASNYDPLGLLAPGLLKAKLIMQSTGGARIGWDDPLEEGTIAEWQEWTESLRCLNELRIPRCLCYEPFVESAVDLVVFCDASSRAYGAVAYFRFELESGAVHVAIVMAKTKLAPMKFVSIPRLELCACLTATRLANTIVAETRLKIRRVVMFTDSTTNLRWLNSGHCKFVVYVANRIGEILESYGAECWRHVPTLLNPADDLSRGLPASEMKLNHRYFTGPDFLKEPPSKWPELPDLELPSDSHPDPEVQALHWVGAMKEEKWRIDVLLSSSMPFTVIKRTVAIALRWLRRVRINKGRLLIIDGQSSAQTDPPPPGRAVTFAKGLKRPRIEIVTTVSAAELEAANNILVYRAQRVAFKKEVTALEKGLQLDPSSSLAKIQPYIDAKGLLRVGGRIDAADVPFDVRHPLILPSRSKVTSRIVQTIHLRSGHSSSWRTLPELLRSYWMPSPRRAIKMVVDRCVLCRRFAARAVPPYMASLPPARLRIRQPPFTATGVDFFGPIEVKVLRSRVKRWGCLFTCLTTRAVDIQMAYGLDTSSFLCALSNFTSARGTPRVIHCDNGTNFVGAKRELGEMLERLEQTKIYDDLASKGIEWRFNPPAAPHFGGSWERLVGTAKRALERVLHQRELTDQSLSCALKQVEHLLNSRPLTLASTDPTAPEPLTPFHALLGRPNPNLPPDVFHDSDLYSRKQWRIAQALTEHFWRRWMAEYLPTLNERRKWVTKERDLQVGDVVLVIDEKTPRGRWPLGLITEVFAGPDGIVRSARVRHRGTELTRPAVKLYLLPLEPDDDEEELVNVTEDASADADGCRAGNVPNDVGNVVIENGLRPSVNEADGKNDN